MTGSGQVLLGILLAAHALESAAQSGGGALRFELDPEEITVGDRVKATLTLEWTGPVPTSEPRFPDWSETWGDAEVLSVGEVETKAVGARGTYRQEVVLTSFRTGRVELPPVTVEVPLAGESVSVRYGEPAGFEVASVLPAGDQELEARPPAPLRSLAPAAAFPWAVGALAAAALAAAFFLARRLRGSHRVEAARLEPLDELLERLRRLDPRAGEPAHTGLSLGLRGFLGRRLRFAALEGTTSEIQRRLRRASIDPAAVQQAVRLLRDCDLVKFARVETVEAETTGRLAEARALAFQIDQALQPPEPAEAAP